MLRSLTPMKLPLLGLALAACHGEPTPDDSAAPAAPTIEVSERCAAIGPDPATVTTFYEHNPSYSDEVDDLLPTGTPEDVGLDATLLDAAIAEIEAQPFTWSLLIVRHGTLVVERYFHHSSAGVSNNVHSSSKSVLGLLVGIAIDEGAIEGVDQPVAELMPELFADLDDTRRAITVGHLLSMTSGLRWTEDRTEARIQEQDDWLAAYLAQPMDGEPGEVFEYSTGSSHLMGAALAHATGQSLCDYAHDRLLTPLYAEAERWGRDPQGYFSGGFNLYLTPRELARFGVMALDEGAWEGKQVAPAEWVRAARSPQANAGIGYSYGYLWWLWSPSGVDVAIAWGYGGQLVYIVPEVDLVMVVTTNTRDQAPDYQAHDVLVNDVLGAVLR